MYKNWFSSGMAGSEECTFGFMNSHSSSSRDLANKITIISISSLISKLKILKMSVSLMKDYAAVLHPLHLQILKFVL